MTGARSEQAAATLASVAALTLGAIRTRSPPWSPRAAPTSRDTSRWPRSPHGRNRPPPPPLPRPRRYADPPRHLPGGPRAIPRALPRPRPPAPRGRPHEPARLGRAGAVRRAARRAGSSGCSPPSSALARPAGLDPIGAALLLCGPIALLAVLLARRRWPRLAGLSSMAAVIALPWSRGRSSARIGSIEYGLDGAGPAAPSASTASPDGGNGRLPGSGHLSRAEAPSDPSRAVRNAFRARHPIVRAAPSVHPRPMARRVGRRIRRQARVVPRDQIPSRHVRGGIRVCQGGQRAICLSR